jgi:hypothetical protein
MVRRLLRPAALSLLLTLPASAFASDPTEPVAPTPAVAAAWAKESPRGPSPAFVNTMLGTYGALTTLDMVSTIRARERGARELNPLMAGSFGQAAATKLALAAATMASVKALEKKSRKAAFFTMVAINVGTAAVVVNNYRHARR